MIGLPSFHAFLPYFLLSFFSSFFEIFVPRSMFSSMIYLFGGHDFTLLFLGPFFLPHFSAVSSTGNSIVQA